MSYYASYDQQLEDRYFDCDYSRADTEVETQLKNKIACIEESVLSIVQNLYSDGILDVIKLEDDISDILWKLECKPRSFIDGTLDIQRIEKPDLRTWEKKRYDEILNISVV